MSKFAKLFERNGRQVLARINTNDDGDVVLFVEGRTVSGHILTLNFIFDSDDATARADGALHAIDEEAAFRFVEQAPGYNL